MDRLKETSDLIVKVNKYKKGEIQAEEIIKEVCSYYDLIKKEELSNADKEFLFNIANSIGIPHYYDTLENFNQDTSLGTISLETMSNCLRETNLFTDNNIKLHKFQKEILDKYVIGQTNRYFLSASTSFGKTFLVYEIIYKMEYQNVLLIFPSIALLSENLEKIYSDPKYSELKKRYIVNTISNGEIKKDKCNIFLFTPERYLSFLDFHPEMNFDFVFVDEVYKMDNEYLVDEEMRENERDVAYRLALFYSLMDRTKDVMLAGPYIEFSTIGSANYNPSFDRFLKDCKIHLLDYNKYEIVNKEFVSRTCSNKTNTLVNRIQDILGRDENCIVYCYSKSSVESYTKKIISDSSFSKIDISRFSDFINHLSTMFNQSNNWIVVKALKYGVGIHHGLIPKYIQKEIINLFNAGDLKILLSTTTITEGINTTAKNLIVLSHKKGDKTLKKFDALNIEGRAGRFTKHYTGTVISLDKKFDEIRKGEGLPIKHKNYDENSPKDDIDLFFTDEKYFNREDKNRKQIICDLQNKYNIPNSVLDSFKVISKEDKIRVFDHISNLSSFEHKNIRRLISYFNIRKQIRPNDNGIETIIAIVRPIVRNNEILRWLMSDIKQGKTTVRLTGLLYAYLKSGINGMVNYYVGIGKQIDEAIRLASDFAYNILKYQVVKYFGVFNLMYKYYLSIKENMPIDQVVGIDAILMKLEYNALTEKGRIASDYGVPQKVIDYYENENRNVSFDSYEQKIFEKVEKLLKTKH